MDSLILAFHQTIVCYPMKFSHRGRRRTNRPDPIKDVSPHLICVDLSLSAIPNSHMVGADVPFCGRLGTPLTISLDFPTTMMNHGDLFGVLSARIMSNSGLVSTRLTQLSKC
jgi:hypothetical protein